MSKSKSAGRKLDEKRVWIAQKVAQKRNELAKEMVKERIKTDAKFASEVLKSLGELLPEDFKKIAQETIARETSPKPEAAPSEEEVKNALAQGVRL